MCMSGDFPAPYIVVDRSSKQAISVNISPYTLGILNGFTSYGMNHPQAIEWLVVSYMKMMQVEQPEPKIQKAPKVKQPKPKKIKQQAPHEKPTFVHNQDSGPVVKKTKIKPKKG